MHVTAPSTSAKLVRMTSSMAKRLAASVVSLIAVTSCSSGIPAENSTTGTPPPLPVPSRSFATGAEVIEAVQRAQNLTAVPPAVAEKLSVSDNAAPKGYFDCKQVSASENPSDASGFGQCAWGDPKGTKQMILYGDGHGSMWMAAMAGVAAKNGYKVRIFALGGCPVPDLQFWSYETKSPNTVCDQFHATAIPAIQALHPDVVVATSAWGKRLADDTFPTNEQWQQGWESTLAKLSSTGAKVAVLGDVPAWADSEPACLKANLQDVQKCSAPVQQAESHAVVPEQAAAATAKALYIPTTQWVCTDRCQPVIADTRVYENEYHMGQSYVVYLSGAISEALKPLL
jgi:hypothetical protein